MSLKKFLLIKIAAKTIVFACVMIAAVSVIQSPTIANQVALGQMQNSDAMYILWGAYPKLRMIINILCAGITVWFTCGIACDTYRFVKNIKNNKEKEKN